MSHRPANHSAAAAARSETRMTPSTVGELIEQNARYVPDHPAFVFEGRSLSHRELLAQSLQLASAFRNSGARRQDRIAILSMNNLEYMAVYGACEVAGFILATVNFRLAPPEFEYILNDSAPRILVFEAQYADVVASLRPKLTSIDTYVCIGQSLDWAQDYVSYLAGGDPAGPGFEARPEDLAYLIYTSGTTGRPKGALGTHRNICMNVLSNAFMVARNYLRRGEMPPQPSPDGPQLVSLLSVPFFHATGSHAILNPSLVGGARLVMQRRFDAGDALRLIEKEKINTAGGVPTIAWQILSHPDRGKYDLSSLQTLSYGGAPSAPELVREIGTAKLSPGNGWGMTETSATFSYNFGEDYAHRPDSCGTAVAVCDAEIRDPEGRVLGPGEIGELYGFGPNIVKGYWRNPEATAETFPDGWVKSGDLARMDAEGFITIVDRAKDMLIRGGENIYCVEVENALLEHPAVMDAALVGRPHRTLGEEPVAFVTTKPGMSIDETALQNFAAERLARFKVPVAIFVRQAPLPRNANGKILKRELKAGLV
jgi:long-chain acyl-CoA synthetase